MFVGLSGDGVTCANDTPIDIDDAPPPRWVTRLASSRTIPEAPRCNGCAWAGAQPAAFFLLSSIAPIRPRVRQRPARADRSWPLWLGVIPGSFALRTDHQELAVVLQHLEVGERRSHV